MPRKETLADRTRAYLMSGQAEELVQRMGSAMIRNAVLKKPFIKDALAKSRKMAHIIHSTTKMVLEPDFVRTSFELAQQHPAILLQFLEYARMPFGKVWIEWNDRSARQPYVGEMDSQDNASLIGVLLRRAEEGEQVERVLLDVFTDVNGKEKHDVSPASVAAQLLLGSGTLSLPGNGAMLSEVVAHTEAAALDLEGANPIYEVLRYIPFSLSLNEIKGEADTDSANALRGRAVMTGDTVTQPLMEALWHDRGTNKHEMADLMMKEMMAMSQTLGIAAAALSLLSMNGEKEMLRIDTVAGGGRVVRLGKPLPLYEYRVISITRPQRAVVRIAKRIAKMGSVDKRWHLVEGHWCHSRKKGDPNCKHDYTRELDKDGKPIGRDRHVCRSCGAKMWRRKEFGRGNSLIGVIEKGYEVTTKPR